MQNEILTTRVSSKHTHEEDEHHEVFLTLANLLGVSFVAILIGAVFALGGIVAWEIAYVILKLSMEVAVIAIIIGAGATVSVSIFAGFLIYRHHKSS